MIKQPAPILRKGPVIWAVAPFETSPHDVRELAELLLLFSDPEQPLEPVSVVSPSDVGWPSAFVPKVHDRLFVRAKDHLNLLLRNLESYKAKKITVLAENSSSRRRAVQTLIQYSIKERAEAIAVRARGMHGVKRMVLGSFTETLIALSPIPVLVIGPHSRPVTAIKKILFPSDLSDSSRRLFETMLTWARERQVEIAIFHQAAADIPAILNSDSRWYNELREEEWSRLKERGRQWAEFARSQGVSCQIEFDAHVVRLSDSVLAEAESKKCDAIFMGVKSGPADQAVLGIETRRILCESTVPVLVARSHPVGNGD